MRALAAAIADFGLEREAFIAIIDGMEMDATGPILAPAMADLQTYCSRVAAAVGLLCIRIFGESGEDGRAVAASLGLALQLTNILRDVREDAEMGRLYLPRELLEAHGIAARDPIEVLHHANLPAVCRDLARRAEAEFAKAEAAIARCSRPAMRPAIIMMKVYQRTLAQLQRRAWRDAATYAPSPLARALDKAAKLLIALRYGLV
jgi:phytoene synthase